MADNAQMNYQIGTFNPITFSSTPGTGPLPMFTSVSVKAFAPDKGKKVSRDGTTNGLIVTGGGKVDIDFTVSPPAGDSYTYSLASAFFKQTTGINSTKGVAVDFPDQALSVDGNAVTWLTVTNQNNAKGNNSLTFEFYLVVYRSDGVWGLIDPLIKNQP